MLVKNFGIKKFQVGKNFGVEKNVGSNKIDGPNISGPMKIFGFGSKEVCFKNFWSTKIKTSKILVKIGSVTAEILPIWTNVARTYVAWTNVTVIVGIFKDVPRNLPLKFGQNYVSKLFLI